MYALPKIRRRIFFYISALVFLAAAPFLILYSIGYVINPQQRLVEKTGGIFIKTNAGGFTVSLNGGTMQKTSLFSRGLLLNNLTPGQYRLRVEKNGYRPWEKIISVAPLSVREIRDIILLPDLLMPKAAADWNAEERLDKAFISPQAHSVALALQHGRTGRKTLIFFNPSENKITARFPLTDAVQEVIWNREATEAVLITGGQTREYKRLILSGAPPERPAFFEKVIMVSGTATPQRIAQHNIKKIRPGNEINDFLILTDAGSLILWNAATTSATLLAEGVEEFEALEDRIFFVAKNGFAALQPVRADTAVNLGRKGYAFTQAPIKVLRSKRGDIFFQDGAGGLFFSSREGTGEFTFIETEIRDIAFDGNEKKLFFLKQNAVGLIHLEDNSYQPFEKRGDVAPLFQSNDTAFFNAAWHENGAHIFLNTASGVFLLDTDIREGPRIAELDPKPAETIFWNQNEKKLYLIRNTGITTIAIE